MDSLQIIDNFDIERVKALLKTEETVTSVSDIFKQPDDSKKMHGILVVFADKDVAELYCPIEEDDSVTCKCWMYHGKREADKNNWCTSFDIWLDFNNDAEYVVNMFMKISAKRKTEDED